MPACFACGQPAQFTEVATNPGPYTMQASYCLTCIISDYPPSTPVATCVDGKDAWVQTILED